MCPGHKIDNFSGPEGGVVIAHGLCSVRRSTLAMPGPLKALPLDAADCLD